MLSESLSLAQELSLIAVSNIIEHKNKVGDEFNIKDGRYNFVTKILNEGPAKFTIENTIYYSGSVGTIVLFKSLYSEYKYTLEELINKDSLSQRKHIFHVVSKQMGFLDQHNLKKKYGKNFKPRHVIVSDEYKVPLPALRSIRKMFTEECLVIDARVSLEAYMLEKDKRFEEIKLLNDQKNLIINKPKTMINKKGK
jgi:hypothetical protein